MPPKSSLGKGLGAMFPDLLDNLGDKRSFILCGIEELFPNRFQARKVFDPKELEDLVTSIRESGIIQPIVARKAEGGYEIIAGERRWRAAQAIGLKEVPVVLRDAADVDTALLSLIENLQRADLNPLEEGTAYQSVMKTFALSQEEVSLKVGKDRSTVANMIRLLRLPKEIRDAVAAKTVSAGHARALLALNTEGEQLQVFRQILKRGLNVRETESLIRKLKTARPAARKETKKNDILDLEERLSKKLMTRVHVKSSKKGGVIEIRFHSPKDLDRLLHLIFGTEEG
jgi:ParB family chromosome partitioning protein